MSVGPLSAADLPRKNEGKSPSFEKIGKGLEQHLLENSNKAPDDGGRASSSEEVLVMRYPMEVTPFQTKPSDVETYGLPNIIMNHRIKVLDRYQS